MHKTEDLELILFSLMRRGEIFLETLKKEIRFALPKQFSSANLERPECSTSFLEIAEFWHPLPKSRLD